MSFLEQVNGVVDGVKKVYNGFKKTIKRAVKTVKFFLSGVGFVVSTLISVMIIILVMLVVVGTAQHAIAKHFNVEYAGISTDADYEVLVGSIGYAGYSSFISEKNWQEFHAYEYSVLIDVAEYIYEGQNKYLAGDKSSYDVVNVKSGVGVSGDKSASTSKEKDDTFVGPIQKDTTSKSNGNGGNTKSTKAASPKYMPYLPVKVEYDMSLITHDNWMKAVIAGQNSARFGLKSPAEVGLEGTGYTAMGGDLGCFPPLLTYEYKSQPYEDGAGSLVPYITVLREENKYRYYAFENVGDNKQIGEGKEATNAIRQQYEKGGAKSTNTENSGVAIDSSNIGSLKLMQANMLLNMFNPYLPKSIDVANDVMRIKLGDDGEKLNLDGSITNYADSKNWPIADEEFPPVLYYTNTGGSTAYKFPLEQLIDRYMPKSSLLTAWYTIKDSDELGKDGEEDSYSFAVKSMMQDIKTIYNYYCLNGETAGDETVLSVQYDEYGKIKRDSDGNAEMADEMKTFAATNEQTFLKFGQAGLQSNRFSVFEMYDFAALSSKGELGPGCTNSEVTGTEVEEVVPVVTDFLSVNAEFLQKYQLKVEFDYSYSYQYTIPKKNTTTSKDDKNDGNEKNDDSSFKVDDDKILIAPFTIEEEGDLGTKYSVGETIVYNGAKCIVLGKKVNLASNSTTYTLGSSGSRTVYGSGIGTSDFNIEYNWEDVSDDEEARETLSDYFFREAIKNAESQFNDNPNIKAAEMFVQDRQTRKFANYLYKWTQEGGVAEKPAAGGGTSVAGKPLSDLEGYHQKFPFYYFAILGVEDEAKDSIRGHFNEAILGRSTDLMDNNEKFRDKVYGIAESNKPDLEDVVKGALPKNAKIIGDVEITGVRIVGFADGTQPEYKLAADFPEKGVFAIDEETVTLTMNVPQKRMSVMLVTEAQSWAKSTSYNIQIVQNPFVPDNYRYVIPHSYFSFGVRVFQISEQSQYRVKMFSKYFSNVAVDKYAIKESDSMNMLLAWEKYAEGSETAYAFMRDLYKLIMCIRQNDGILKTGYTYMYLDDSVWDFDDGITQMAFWTERLAAEGTGQGDALTQAEQKRMRTKKDNIYWQVVDYQSYPECVNSSRGVAAVYGLFPFGSPYIRTYYMMNALETGKFYGGGFKNGHAGADWTGRAVIKKILKQEAGVAGDVYTYALKQMKARRKINNGNTLTASDAFLNSLRTTTKKYSFAESELNAELTEYSKMSPLVSAAPGIVIKAEYNCYSGFCVNVLHTISDNYTVTTHYVHMKRWPNVQVGDIVGAGTIVGYEGTTGNSGGYHLHMGVKVNGEMQSPSKYFAPIFSPFYNQEKALEVRTNANGNKNAILASEYYSLMRTVLLQNVADGQELYSDGQQLGNGDLTFLRSAAFYTSGDGTRYVVFDESDIATSVSASAFFYVQNDGENKKYIIKEGVLDPKYWQCSLKLLEDSTSQNDSDSGDFSGSGANNSNYLPESSTRILAEVISAEQVNLTNIGVGGISVQTDESSYAGAGVVWGNNVPIEPLVPDIKMAVSAASITAEKTYEPFGEATDPGIDLEGYGGYDVRAQSAFFDINSALAQKRLQLPAGLLLRFADIENPLVVGFYDGPVSTTVFTTDNKYPGGMITDLVQLQQSFKAKGIISSGDNIMSGDYDENMAKVIEEKLVPILSAAGFPTGVEAGNLGRISSTDNFSIHYVCYYNMYVVYGTLSNAKDVGMKATYMAAVVAGLDPTFIMGIAGNAESGFQPGIESHEIPKGKARGDAKAAGLQYSYGGRLKNLRRAQGVMQLLPPTAMGIYRSMGITDTETMISMMRTPYTNALTAASYIKNIINGIYAGKYDKAVSYAEIKDMAQSSEWKKVAKRLGMSPETLITYLTASAMYNQGPHGKNVHSTFAAFANLHYDDGAKSASGIPSYQNGVLNYMLAQVPDNQ